MELIETIFGGAITLVILMLLRVFQLIVTANDYLIGIALLKFIGIVISILTICFILGIINNLIYRLYYKLKGYIVV